MMWASIRDAKMKTERSGGNVAIRWWVRFAIPTARILRLGIVQTRNWKRCSNGKGQVPCRSCSDGKDGKSFGRTEPKLVRTDDVACDDAGVSEARECCRDRK